MSTVATSEEENAIPRRRVSVSRHTSFKSLKIHDNVKKQPKNNEDMKEIDEKEVETLQLQNNIPQNIINKEEKTDNSSNISLEDLLQKQQQKMQQLTQENEELKTELRKNQDLYSEKVLFLTQKNEDTIKKCDQKINQLISQKHKITLLLPQEQHNEIHFKLQSMEEKYKIAVNSDASYKAQMQQMETEMKQLNIQNVDSADNVCEISMGGSNEMLSMKERSFEDSKASISYSKLYISAKVKWYDNYYNMKYILRQYFMTRVIVSGIGMWILPTKLVASASLGTVNVFNWMCAYKYGTKGELLKQSILCSVELFSATYLSDIKHIGAGIAIHGLSDLFNVYQLYIDQKNNHQMTSIIKEVGISAMLNVVIGVGTMLLSPKPRT